LQHTDDPQVLNVADGIEQHTECKQDDRAFEYLGKGITQTAFCRQLLAVPKHDRDAHDEKKKREDQVRGGQTVPVGMSQGWVNVVPDAGAVDDNHAGNGQTPECIQGDQSLLLLDVIVFLFFTHWLLRCAW